MIEKYIPIGGYDWGDCDVKPLHTTTFEKTAAQAHTPDELLDVISGIKEDPGGVYLLINALGASEVWSCNRNGDAFPEWSIKGEAPPPEVGDLISQMARSRIPNWCSPAPGTYGYETFVSNAHPFIFHQNKDPRKATGRVVAAAYNDKMHRAELVIFLDADKDPDGVRAVRAGEYIPFSMGARVKADFCMAPGCGNAARNRSEYCPHIRHMLKHVEPSGVKHMMYNFHPVFFDISRVRSPADPTAWMLRKVASSGMWTPPSGIDIVGEALKVARVAKSADIKKEIPADGGSAEGHAGADQMAKMLAKKVVREQHCGGDITNDPQVMQIVQERGLGPAIGATAMGGILLRPRELGGMMRATGEQIPRSLELDKITRRLMSMVGAHAPRRSLIAIHLKSRKLAQLDQSAMTGYRDPAYQQYLGLLKKHAADIVVNAMRPERLIELDPDLIGRAMLKSASASAKEEDWIPFLAALEVF